MTDIHTEFIDISRLRIGLFVYLDMGWMEHPFPVSNFRISSQEQILKIRSLGLERIRYAPAKSDPEPQPVSVPAEVSTPAAPEESTAAREARERRELLASQAASLQLCEKQFSQASMAFRSIHEKLQTRPEEARATAEHLISGFLDEILSEDEAAIRVLSENAGEKTSLHSVNVVVISLLLGKVLGLNKTEMLHLGTGALLHDIGKMLLPERLRWVDEHFNHSEKQLFQEHVAHGVLLARKMGLPAPVQLLIGQHHEYFDGSGYPTKASGDRLSPPSRILSLVNYYDNLCNPANPALAITPHEALSQIFTQFKARFHAPTMTAFIRMMGIYPPGSVVQLTDERFAMVVSVNSSRPIKPRVVIHDASVPRDEALVINLEHEPYLGIHKSLKPLQLPKAAFDYLSPRKRLCYFFERGLDAGNAGGGEA